MKEDKYYRMTGTIASFAYEKDTWKKIHMYIHINRV